MKIAIVTGATRGLGRHIAATLASAGTAVIATYRSDPKPVEEIVAQIRATGHEATSLQLDVASIDSITSFATAVPDTTQTLWGRRTVDALVNNAGVGRFGPLDTITPDDLEALWRTNVRGPFLLTQAIAPILCDGGAIVNITSSASQQVGTGMAAYAASKAALDTLSRNLAHELGPRGIRVNALAPGPTATDFNGGAMRDDHNVRAFLSDNTALGRVGDPQEIADAVRALLCTDLRWVTGERIEVSGGVRV
ncbi:SDR family NAD(P)-dependent oxidoreductase [Litorihabitans aurantiacus]|uniref:Short-chain dehydrogenase n=1 Tax=Litorihabitans aurantiacus TaxID=1930061 RepID=A0AA37XID7_9MICO|nr:SDR family oxidoreductase [Litorihabitans aurantiacus]GMA33678.1 short-chain dehydrogenase [Litorihabitans aurantiacus]GMA33747.1 short-chain dehydrogenase [Litorihabitans aurantiacus]GMA33751.1 short-chain dehydrogenase [Litorihabitans aurantiacus]